MFPDKTPADEIAAALSSMTLAMGRRWMLVEGVERWKDKEVQSVAEALDGLPPDTIVVLIATGPIKRDKPGPAPAKLVKAVEKCGGEITTYKAPTASQYAKWTAEQASKVGLSMSVEAGAGAGGPGRPGRQAPPARTPADAGAGEDRDLRARRRARGPGDGGGADRLGRRGAHYELADALVDGNLALARLACGGSARPRGGHHVRPVRAAAQGAGHAHGLGGAGGGRLEEGRRGCARRAADWMARPIVAQAERADGARLERLATALADLDYAVRGGANVDAGTELTLMVAGAERTRSASPGRRRT